MDHSAATKQAREKRSSQDWAKRGFALHEALGNTFYGFLQMESHFLCFCISLRSKLWMSANSSVSNATASVNRLYLSPYPFIPSECCRAAAAFSLERNIQMVEFWSPHAASGDHCACVGCNDRGTAFYVEYLLDTGSVFGFASCLVLACLSLSAQPPPTSAAGPVLRNSRLGQEPTFWLRKINLNGCSSEFNDPC